MDDSQPAEAGFGGKVKGGKKIAILISIGVVVAIFIATIVVYMIGNKKVAQEEVVEDAKESTVSALETIETVSDNPVEQAPDLNPVEAANPFTDVYKNPFE